MQVPMTGAAIVHELTSVLDNVVSTGYAITDDMKASNVARLNALFEPIFAFDTSGLRSGGSPAADGLRQAVAGLEELGSYGRVDFAPFIDGMSTTLKAAVDLV